VKGNLAAGRLARYILIGVVLAIALFPIYWAMSTSLKSKFDALANPPAWVFKPTLENYSYITYSRIAFPRYLRNSIIISVGATLIAMSVGTLAAYSFARFNFKGKKNLAFWMLSTRMMPAPAVVLPIYILMRELRLIDTHLAPMLTHTIITLPFAVWVMRGFFEEIPFEIEESALVDGCSRLRTFWRIILPLSAPGLVVTALFCLMFSWNEFLFALVLTSTNAKTATVACTEFRGWMETAWGPACSAATITFVPILLITLFLQRHLVRGLSLGAIK
jgi:ABC-type glycerol-3-phosphate transport system permease component